ncbi:MAG: exopolysaccharide biosynthesis polyprenyl glycosylphosphotransferase [Solirubrobacterales bacterium]|nr:exopolysaccharide biosynthesis polyprenyl glycosylphosphotransferase [Solirubrobacterales bacterium]
MLAAADLLAGLLATTVATVPAAGSAWPLIFLPLWPLVAKLFGLYDRDHRALRHITADEVPTILALTATITALVALLLPLTPAESLGGLNIVSFFIVATVAGVGLRALARWTWWKRTPPELVGLIGDRPVLESLRRKVGLFLKLHLELAAEQRIDALDSGRDRSEQLNRLAEGVDRIVVAARGVEADLIGELKDICRRRQVKLSVVSPLRGKALPSDRTAQLADLPILEYNTWDPSRSTQVIKRIFDLLMASAGLILFAPFFAVIAVLIKLDSQGPVIFSQIRAGRGGRPFRIYKLRTMSDDAEARLDGLIDFNQLDDPVFKLRDDPRVTRVGRFLRRFSIDEVPQLLNVLVGEMSMVGPRPEQVELVERYSGDELAKLGIKPGVTGPMQVFGRGELTFNERIAVELEYVENASLGRDVRILIHTLPAVLRGTGAY